MTFRAPATLLTAAFAATIASAALAADMGQTFLPAAPPLEPMQTWGTGWYLRGDIGWSSDKSARPLADPRYFSSPLPALPAAVNFSSLGSKENSWSGGLGAGYKFNDWFRMDGTVEYRKGPSAASTTQAMPCPPAGGLFQCVGHTDLRQRQWIGLLNGYLDLGNWSGITPYVGAGAGAVSLTTRGGLTYQTTAAAPGIILSQDIKTRSYRFAWALMGGVAIDVSDNAKIDVGYRYLDMGSYKAFDATTGGEVNHKAKAHEVRVGFRYMID